MWLSRTLAVRNGCGLRPRFPGYATAPTVGRRCEPVVHKHLGPCGRAWPPAPGFQPTTRDRQRAAGAARLSTGRLAMRTRFGLRPRFRGYGTAPTVGQRCDQLSTSTLAGGRTWPPAPGFRPTARGRQWRAGAGRLSTGSLVVHRFGAAGLFCRWRPVVWFEGAGGHASRQDQDRVSHWAFAGGV